MDASHFIVGGFTSVAVAFLVWAEIRSRRNTAAEQETSPVSLPEPLPPPNEKKRRRR